jgi:hypothetical protein
MAIYLPAGCRWMDWWDGAFHDGGQVLDYDTSDVGKLPLFVREGGILPMQEACQWIESGDTPDPLYLTLVPPAEGAQARFDLLEDDGVSLRYQQGEVGRTPIVCRREAGQAAVEIGGAEGGYRGRADARRYVLVLRGMDAAPVRAACNGREIPQGEATPESGGWSWDEKRREAAISLPRAPATDRLTVRIAIGR